MSEQDIGASLRDRAGHEPSQSSLSRPAGDHPLRVVDYIALANPDDVAAAYAAQYGTDDGYATPTAFTQFRQTLNAKIGISRTDNMRVLLRHVIQEWSKHPGCGDDEDYIDVGGANDEASNWSLSFTPWGEWKLLPVEDATGKRLTVTEVATHLYYEITWHGSAEDAADKFVHVKDLANEAAIAIEARSDTTAKTGVAEGKSAAIAQKGDA